MLVFVYGTLTDEATAVQVLEDGSFVGDAVLSGLHQVDGDYPTLAPGGRVEGRLLQTTAIGRLDAYEGVDRGLYVRVAVPFDTGAAGIEGDTVAVYVGDPDRLGVEVEWPGDGPFEKRVGQYVETHAVSIHRDRQD